MSFSYVLPENLYFKQVVDIAQQPTSIIGDIAPLAAQISLPTVYTIQNSGGKLPIVTVSGAGAGLIPVLSAAQQQALVTPGFVFIDGANAGAGNGVSFGSDSAATAASLIGALGLGDVTPARMFVFKSVDAVGGTAIPILNVSGSTYNYVSYSYAGGAASNTAQLLPASSTQDAYVIASINGTDSFGNNKINFNVVYP